MSAWGIGRRSTGARTSTGTSRMVTRSALTRRAGRVRAPALPSSLEHAGAASRASESSSGEARTEEKMFIGLSSLLRQSWRTQRIAGLNLPGMGRPRNGTDFKVAEELGMMIVQGRRLIWKAAQA